MIPNASQPSLSFQLSPVLGVLQLLLELDALGFPSEKVLSLSPLFGSGLVDREDGKGTDAVLVEGDIQVAVFIVIVLDRVEPRFHVGTA
jgi:hypothetical protein